MDTPGSETAAAPSSPREEAAALPWDELVLLAVADPLAVILAVNALARPGDELPETGP